jgi:hypothetical protein
VHVIASASWSLVLCSTTPVVYSCATQAAGSPNYSDLSTDNGFQFEFRCDRWGNGYRTEFDTFELSTATNVLDGASGLLGGFFGQAADVAQRAKSAAWEKASDKAFRKASEEIRPKFVQCPRCSAWMCREQCWNE